jgi:hypothetical protein
MLLESFKITAVGVGQSFILGAVGYFLIKRRILHEEGLNALSRLVIEITMPALIFGTLIKKFDFILYPDWWFYPLLSICITLAGFGVGLFFLGAIRGTQEKLQFLSLNAFQNSGYLPLVLVASILTQAQAQEMFIYLFLFLLGFNLLMFSFGVYLLTFTKEKEFDWNKLFNPAVIATFAGLIAVFLGIHKFIPESVLKPLQMAGDCTLPLAMFVVGGNIASIRLIKISKKPIALLILGKLVILPALGVWFVYQIRLPWMLGLLVIMELAMPPATTLSVILSQHKKQDCLISQGIFFGHIVSLITIPLFLSLYFMISMVK